MKRFSDSRKIKSLSNPIGKKKISIHPISLSLIINEKEENIVPSQFFIAENKTIQFLQKNDKKKTISRNLSQNMETPDLSLPLTDILNIYDIDNYDELIQKIKEMIENDSSSNTIDRIINIYTRVFFDELKKNNNTLIKIFKLMYVKMDDNKAKTFFKKWFDSNKIDDFNLNISKDFKNFLSK